MVISAATLCRLFHYVHGLYRYFFLFPPPNKEFGKPHVCVFAPQNFLFFDGQIEGRQRGGWRVAILGGSRSFRKRKDAPPMARSDINKEPSGNKSSVSPKVAATSSPTTQCSTIGDAVSLPLSLSLLPSPLRSAALRCLPPLPAPLLSALSPAPAPSPARRRRAHRRPPRASDALREGYGATRS